MAAFATSIEKTITDIAENHTQPPTPQKSTIKKVVRVKIKNRPPASKNL
jgi:vacuolar-type H+-ATPase subunit F/Vma7